MPVISVIIPVYNSGKTIKRCLDSITAQTFGDMEIIVVNDGSTDDTLEALKSVCDRRVRVITIPNGGQGFARNRGMEEAKGDYLAFVDADDTIEPEMLAVMHSAALKYNSDIVQCNMYDVYPNGEKRVQLVPRNETVDISDKGTYMDLYFTPCIHSYEVCNKLIKRETAAGLKFRDTRKYFSEDLMFNLELISRINRITLIAKPLYNYYQNYESHMHSDAERRLAGLCALFSDYISGADNVMRSAASYTASMVILYSAGCCADTLTGKRVLSGEKLSGFIKSALKRKCKFSHRLFLTAILISPLFLKIKLTKWYGGRWRV